MTHPDRFTRPTLRAVSAIGLVFVAWPRDAAAQDPFGGAHYEEPAPRLDPLRGDPADWDPELPEPAGYHVEPRVRRNLIIRGAGLFAIWYFPAAAVAALAREPALWVPIAGPFIQLAQTPTNAAGALLLAMDGFFQSVGAAMIVYGVAVPTRVLVRDVGPARVSVAPLSLGAGAHGVGIVGRF